MNAAESHRGRLVAYPLLAVLSAGLFLHALRLPSSRWEPLGAGTFPAIILALLCGLCLLGAILELRRTAGGGEGEWKGRLRHGLMRHRLVIGTFALFATCVLLLPILGFGPASFLFLLAAQLFLAPLNPRTVLVALLLALVFSFGLAWLFAELFEIFLPRGQLGW